MLWFLKKIPPDKIFPRSYMDFEQKYQKDPGSYMVIAVCFPNTFVKLTDWMSKPTASIGDGIHEKIL